MARPYVSAHKGIRSQQTWRHAAKGAHVQSRNRMIAISWQYATIVHMKQIFFALLCLFVTAVFASAQDTKPTREQIIEFLEEWQNRPLTEEEQTVGRDKREKVDLVKQFGTDFSGLDLSGINFSNVDLRYAKFYDTLLKNTNFTNAYLFLADFGGADIEGAIFDGANLYAATFIDLKGIDDTQRKSLERRSARWYYDFKQNFYTLLSDLFIPSYLLVVIATIIFSIIGLCSKETKTRLFVIACFPNGFAIFSTFCTLLMMFSGGHPVRQMSAGNWNAWSTWLHFFPIPALGLLLCILVSFVLVCIALVQLFWKLNDRRQWKLFAYLGLTLAHAILAFNWLMMFMPDA